jgi:hypothetical protein
MLSWRVVRIDDSLRRAFLDARDRVVMILEHLEELPHHLINVLRHAPTSRCAEGEDILYCIAKL